MLLWWICIVTEIWYIYTIQRITCTFYFYIIDLYISIFFNIGISSILCCLRCSSFFYIKNRMFYLYAFQEYSHRRLLDIRLQVRRVISYHIASHRGTISNERREFKYFVHTNRFLHFTTHLESVFPRITFSCYLTSAAFNID